VNIYGFPDIVENAIYKNVLKIVLHAAGHMADNSGILFLGHKIKIIIEPVEENLENLEN
jgi:hypothetical protein